MKRVCCAIPLFVAAAALMFIAALPKPELPEKELLARKTVYGNALFATCDFDYLVKKADLIIIGTYNGEVATEKRYMLDLEEEYDREIMKVKNMTMDDITYLVTASMVDVEKTLYQYEDYNFDKAKFVQLGEADYGETKLKEGHRYLLIIQNLDKCMDKPDIKKTYFNIKGRYWEKGKNNFSSVNIEDSIFEILDGDIVMSYSDNPATTYYDGVPLDILVRDINALLVKNAS